MGSPEIPPTQVPPGLPQDVAKRLLEAWRGEIEARAVYEALAAREKDERRAAVLRRMASGEKGHLERVEARMRALGIPIPDPATVRLSRWQKLQTRVAPIERVLASREAPRTDEHTSEHRPPTDLVCRLRPLQTSQDA